MVIWHVQKRDTEKVVEMEKRKLEIDPNIEPNITEITRDQKGNITQILYLYENVVLYALRIDRDFKGSVIKITKGVP